MISAIISEIDNWRSANLMLKQQGENAAFEAAQRVDALVSATPVPPWHNRRPKRVRRHRRFYLASPIEGLKD